MEIIPPAQKIIDIEEQKQHRIGYVCKLFKVSDSTLRHWQSKFEQLQPRVTKSNQRSYSKRDLEIIWIIKYLLYYQQFTFKGAKEKLDEIIERNLDLTTVEQDFNQLFYHDDKYINDLKDELKKLRKEKKDFLNVCEQNNIQIEKLKKRATKAEEQKLEQINILLQRNSTLEQHIHQLKEKTNLIQKRIAASNATQEDAFEEETFNAIRHELSSILDL